MDRVLVLGGTKFVGKAIVEALLRRGDEVVLFNRGTDRAVFPDVERIIGDRNDASQLEQIGKREWDAVVDVNGYTGEQAHLVLGALTGSPYYLDISTVSVYDDPAPGTDESGALSTGTDVDPNDPRTGYGWLKAQAERVLRDELPGRLAIFRPTIIIGPDDYTGRFTKWVDRIAAGGELPVPERLDQPLQLIDAADIGAFAASCVSGRITGIFNTVGPAEPLTLGSMISDLEDALGTRCDRVTVYDDTSLATIPLLLPSDGSGDGLFSLDGTAAYARGLELTPLRESARRIRASRTASASL